MKNIKIILKKAEAEFLNTHLARFAFNPGTNYLPLAQCKDVFEDLISLFAEIGLDESDEPTKLGLYIEDLTDIFNKPLLDIDPNDSSKLSH